MLASLGGMSFGEQKDFPGLDGKAIVLSTETSNDMPLLLEFVPKMTILCYFLVQYNITYYNLISATACNKWCFFFLVCLQRQVERLE
mmetsp:Transcript_15115/g.23468  ORF Transcript_15115/g.23468 Transcript_15115/m.23468 type:complete len:87 (-) Transcript_15115:961-1221(-)